MSASVEREHRLVEYLLGGLPPEERAQTEEHLFADDDLHEQFQATTDDLIHAYLAGTLPQDDRVRFEGHFLASPRRRERLEFMRGLLAAVDRVSVDSSAGRAGTRHAWPSWMLPAAAALILSTILVVLLRTSPQETQRTSVSPEPVISATPSPGPQEAPVPQRPKPVEVSVTRLVRGSAEPASVLVTPDTRLVRLEVALTEDRPSYDAVLRTADGAEVWRAEGLAPSKAGELLAVAVPAHIFTSDAYALAVEGEALRGAPQPAPRRVEYRLRVVRER